MAPVTWCLAKRPQDLWLANASWPVVGMMMVLAAVCGAMAFWLMNRWQPAVPPTQAGLIYSFEPLFVSVYALFLPAWLGQWGGCEYANEHLTANLWIGGTLITVANVLIPFAARPE
jgi:drug/metabolite transporter (DMT)-like permease